jgi:hypothetical protein
MAAPEYVPVKPIDDVRTYESPPRRPDPWLATRPGDLGGSNPRGPLFGDQGPDQGYGLVLAKRMVDKLHLQPGESVDDAIEGGLAVALKRASILGRAPVIHDMTVAYTVWGFLDPNPAIELVTARRNAFDEAALPGHYRERQLIAAAVSEEVLRLPHAAVIEQHARDWRSLLDLSVFEEAHG